MLEMYSVYDSKAERYLQPFFSETDGTATRAVAEVLRDPNHRFSLFAEDFVLFHVGGWDDVAGLVVAFSAPRSVVGLWIIQASLAKKES